MKRYIPYGHHCIDNRDIQEVIKVLKSNWITQGPKVKDFESALCKYTGAKYAVAVSSGTAGLHIACLSAGISNGDEVITSPITFVASANCVLYCGARPVFADICEDTVNIDPEEIKKKINKKTKAIIPVHFAGHPCDLEEIYKIAKNYNLTVIEDACHALGAEYKGSKIGSCKYSDMAVFSFHPVKSITTGEGGAVLTNRKDLYEKLLLFRNHGITKDRTKLINKKEGPWYYEMQELGLNYRITDFQCALGLSQLKKLDFFLKQRREIVAQYNEVFKDVKEIKRPVEREYVRNAWHIYVVRLNLKKLIKKQREIFEQLRSQGIGVQVHYIPVYYQPYYQRLGYQKGISPIAESYYKEAITLPLYPKMSDDDIKKVINSVIKVVEYAQV